MVLSSFDPHLQSTIEEIKLNMAMPEYEGDLIKRLIFKAKFEDNTIILTIPVNRISLEERDDKLNSKFKVKINIYLNHKRIDGIEETKILSESKEEFLSKKNVILKIPFKPTLKGKY